MVGYLGKNSDIHLVLEGIDENSHREKRSKDDLIGRTKLKMELINAGTIIVIKLHFKNKIQSKSILFLFCQTY